MNKDFRHSCHQGASFLTFIYGLHGALKLKSSWHWRVGFCFRERQHQNNIENGFRFGRWKENRWWSEKGCFQRQLILVNSSKTVRTQVHWADWISISSEGSPHIRHGGLTIGTFIMGAFWYQNQSCGGVDKHLEGHSLTGNSENSYNSQAHLSILVSETHSRS